MGRYDEKTNARYPEGGAGDTNPGDEMGYRHFGDGTAGPFVAARIAGYYAGGTDYRDAATDDDGHLQVDVLSGGGGSNTQYNEGDTDATITGTAIMWEDTGDTLRPVSAATPLPVDLQDTSVAITAASLPLPTGAATEATLAAIQTAVEILDNVVSGSEAQVDVLTVPADPFGANADAAATAGSTGSMQAKLRLVTSQLDSIKTAVETLDNAISGSEMQVDVLTMPTVTVDSELTTADVDSGAGTDTRAVVGLVGTASGGGQLIPGSSTDGLLVNLGTNNDVTVSGVATEAKQDTIIGHVDGLEGLLGTIDTDTGNMATSLGVMDDWDNAASDGASVSGDVAHGTADAGEPVKVGLKAIAHGTNPTAVDAADRTDWYANRAGVPWVIGGHPNVVCARTNYTAAQTDAALVTVSAGTKIVVTRCSVTVDNACSVDVAARIGFGAANTPTGTGVVLSHPGIAAGSGVVEGAGAGILGVGADGEDLRITSEVPTGGSIDVVISYYTVES